MSNMLELEMKGFILNVKLQLINTWSHLATGLWSAADVPKGVWQQTDFDTDLSGLSD